jgi:hypothetical protein
VLVRIASARRTSVTNILTTLIAIALIEGPVVWVLLGEMFPNRIRAAALGVAAAGSGRRTG